MMCLRPSIDPTCHRLFFRFCASPPRLAFPPELCFEPDLLLLPFCPDPPPRDCLGTPAVGSSRRASWAEEEAPIISSAASSSNAKGSSSSASLFARAENALLPPDEADEDDAGGGFAMTPRVAATRFASLRCSSSRDRMTCVKAFSSMRAPCATWGVPTTRCWVSLSAEYARRVSCTSCVICIERSLPTRFSARRSLPFWPAVSRLRSTTFASAMAPRRPS
mmetsp:Transcript_1800/g.2212  ORF Transcript_1800/g.2212 Transcript_1800/m.2212 type:complete len:221 (-) Transcript_1800:576-1238(-)